MKKPINIILLASLFVMVLDTLGSLISRISGFPYPCLAPISFLIYAIAGFLVARRSSLWMSLLAGVIIGFVDATIGWTISWIIGPGRLTGSQFSVGLLLFSAFFALIIAIVGSLSGGAVGLLSRKTELTEPVTDRVL